MPHDVFISHSSQDRLIAEAVCNRLEGQNLRCWIAPRDIREGQEWGEAIVEGLEGCKVVVLVFSSSANQSTYVRAEVERAVSKRKWIIPLRVEDVAPSKKLELFISHTHWLDALTPPVDQYLGRLADQIRKTLEAGEESPLPAPMARARASRRHSLLAAGAVVLAASAVGLALYRDHTPLPPPVPMTPEQLAARRIEAVAAYLRTAKEHSSPTNYKIGLAALDELLKVEPSHDEARNLRRTLVVYGETPLTWSERAEVAADSLPANERAPILRRIATFRHGLGDVQGSKRALDKAILATRGGSGANPLDDHAAAAVRQTQPARASVNDEGKKLDSRDFDNIIEFARVAAEAGAVEEARRTFQQVKVDARRQSTPGDAARYVRASVLFWSIRLPDDPPGTSRFAQRANEYLPQEMGEASDEYTPGREIVERVAEAQAACGLVDDAAATVDEMVRPPARPWLYWTLAMDCARAGRPVLAARLFDHTKGTHPGWRTSAHQELLDEVASHCDPAQTREFLGALTDPALTDATMALLVSQFADRRQFDKALEHAKTIHDDAAAASAFRSIAEAMTDSGPLVDAFDLAMAQSRPVLRVACYEPMALTISSDVAAALRHVADIHVGNDGAALRARDRLFAKICNSEAADGKVDDAIARLMGSSIPYADRQLLVGRFLAQAGRLDDALAVARGVAGSEELVGHDSILVLTRALAEAGRVDDADALIASIRSDFWKHYAYAALAAERLSKADVATARRIIPKVREASLRDRLDAAASRVEETGQPSHAGVPSVVDPLVDPGPAERRARRTAEAKIATSEYAAASEVAVKVGHGGDAILLRLVRIQANSGDYPEALATAKLMEKVASAPGKQLTAYRVIVQAMSGAGNFEDAAPIVDREFGHDERFEWYHGLAASRVRTHGLAAAVDWVEHLGWRNRAAAYLGVGSAVASPSGGATGP